MREDRAGGVMDILELKEELLLLVDRLDNLVYMAGNKALPDDIHMTALRGALPDLALELREHIETL